MPGIRYNRSFSCSLVSSRWGLLICNSKTALLAKSFPQLAHLCLVWTTQSTSRFRPLSQISNLNLQIFEHFFDRARFILHLFFFVSIFYHNRDNCTFLDQISHGSWVLFTTHIKSNANGVQKHGFLWFFRSESDSLDPNQNLHCYF